MRSILPHRPFFSHSSHVASASAASAVTSGTSKKGSAAQRAARHKAEQTRVAQAALRAFIASVRVPRFDAAVLMALEDLEDCDKMHSGRDVNYVCLEADGSDAVSMESSTSDAPSESNSQNNSNSSTQQSQGLVSGVKDVCITSGPCSNGECGENGEGEEDEEEEDNEQEDLGLTSEQYLYFVAALCQGMSGRSLRKLPIKAHSYYVQRPVVSVMEFLCAMHAVIALERGDTED
eukprot:gene23155-26216_t